MEIGISVNVNAANANRLDDSFNITLSEVRVKDLKGVLKSLPEALAKSYAGIVPINLNKENITPSGAEEFIRANCIE